MVRHLWFIAWCIGLLSLRAAEVIPPALAAYFNDYASTVSAAQAATMNRQLEDFEKSTSNQVVVAIFPKMQSDSSIEDYTVRVAQKWRVGQKIKSNGAVLFVFVQDRKMYIQVGYGLEGALTDALSRSIIENEIKPHFKQGDYAGGLQAGISAILAATQHEYKGTNSTVADNDDQMLNLYLFLFIFAVILYVAYRSSKNGSTRYGSGGMTYWGGGWGGGSSGGGGFSGGGFSGGGGGFGGGGAGGSW